MNKGIDRKFGKFGISCTTTSTDPKPYPFNLSTLKYTGSVLKKKSILSEKVQLTLKKYSAYIDLNKTPIIVYLHHGVSANNHLCKIYEAFCLK